MLNKWSWLIAVGKTLYIFHHALKINGYNDVGYKNKYGYQKMSSV